MLRFVLGSFFITLFITVSARCALYLFIHLFLFYLVYQLHVPIHIPIFFFLFQNYFSCLIFVLMARFHANNKSNHVMIRFMRIFFFPDAFSRRRAPTCRNTRKLTNLKRINRRLLAVSLIDHFAADRVMQITTEVTARRIPIRCIRLIYLSRRIHYSSGAISSKLLNK